MLRRMKMCEIHKWIYPEESECQRCFEAQVKREIRILTTREGA